MKNKVKRFFILTIFPDFFQSFLQFSIIKRALEKKKIKIYVFNIRDYADKKREVDDYEYGGGGMVLKIQPIVSLLEHIISTFKLKKFKVILFSAQGKILNQKRVFNYSSFKEEVLILICGHYEGIDERIMHFIDEEISIGKFVMTGGEIPAMVFIDTIVRLIPGVINSESLQNESYNQKNTLDYPCYTKPRIFRNLPVPSILLTGNDKLISLWRKQMSLAKTLMRKFSQTKTNKIIPKTEWKIFQILQERFKKDKK